MATKGQIAARERNWRVRRLRGLWHNVKSVVQCRLRETTIKSLIDDELAALGAETEGAREYKRRKALADEFAEHA